MRAEQRYSIVIRFVAVAATLAAFAAPALCGAQSFPNRPVRFLSDVGAGGATDVFARIMCEGLSQALGQPVLTENRVGANGFIALDAIAKAAPDGYTIGLGNTGGLVVGPLLRPAPFDPIKSFTHIGQIVESPFALVVSTQSKITSVPQLLAYARANPGKLNFGSTGLGSTLHLALEWLKLKEGVDIVHIPFKNDIDIVPALKTNDIQVTVYAVSIATQWQQQGLVKILASLTPTREADMPDVPTVAEAGLPDFLIGAWVSIVGPAGMPHEIVQRMNSALASYGARPEVQARLRPLLKPKFGSPEDSVVLLTKDIARTKEIVDRAKIKVD